MIISIPGCDAIPHPRVLLSAHPVSQLDIASELFYTQPGLDVVAMRIHADDADRGKGFKIDEYELPASAKVLGQFSD